MLELPPATNSRQPLTKPPFSLYIRIIVLLPGASSLPVGYKKFRFPETFLTRQPSPYAKDREFDEGSVFWYKAF
ncbi:MAG: hypothetical protein OP8BY_0244 [Candidatus Saccharicenans subterraneus]|uniref:Uncharacterized protein n=1 Tax=Candidatus Saccharicenans subterraneus TaxID=2508984 RepID=A0A3E2BLW0_9BACT|nr:MAG: hypothetical protein OP8BY_0244 [Candidatus Saccharicenans subterraneum]